ncbi:flippase-like domain-containing protein [Subsaximicrobium wynnwilliamsii]|uniref:Flippase-like domain-containing protein n=1 Tax=Subsaximicrobium wynnwilliamsii TaxID=291179 RepID=A0A5C6ZEC5_9FLAO|nr:lysylphosphatidylglycerol synthase transmembrane domain-containing protein [Subsaximicrobium wynnwilliamsii]TXD82515.1 flippase-like domain-containing protein [Subsaximicrobium wynnwilliamsii]TXD88158.1 flippase-like domain-containing protein [Subsaximicrobium wynnwilliamsii]TXE02173.1 flippase-like domain-containing protein [Subsaximicrobium wynnwilliamsii]
MNKSTAKFLKITLPLLLGVALVWYSLSKISTEELLRYFKNADYLYIIIGLICGLLSHLSRAYRWKFMIEPLGYTLRYANSIMAVFATYLVNYTIPRAGEITRATIITNYEGVPFEKTLGTIVAERIADMFVLLAIIALTLFLEFNFIYDFFMQRFDAYKLLIAILIFVCVAVGLFLFIKKSGSKLAIKIRAFVSGLIEGALAIFKMKKKWAFIAHTLFIWLMYVLMFYVTTFAIPETSNLPLAAILIGFISGSFSIAATNGGIGSYPVAIFAAFSIFGIAEEPAIAFGWIMWSSQTLMVIVLGGLSLIYLPIYNKIK